jgi:hypothetical protein
MAGKGSQGINQTANGVLLGSDIMNVKVFLRTYNDAIDCAQQIASRESSRDHYKSYIKTLITALKKDQV